MTLTPFDVCRFWQRVNQAGPGECWLWDQKSRRYGNFSIGKTNHLAHRISYIIHYGPIPDDLIVRHTCDVGRCVNPCHLVTGTQLDNRLDCVERGRTARGTEHGLNVLTPELIAEIRRAKARDPYVTGRRLALDFGVSETSMSRVLRHETWLDE